MAFLVYLYGKFESVLKQASVPQLSHRVVARCVVRLLRGCPNSAVTLRKDVLVGTRHILQSKIFRKAFQYDVDKFLDEGALLGCGRASHDALRAQALSTVADLVHHVRSRLSMRQIDRVLRLFAQIVADPTLPLGI